MWFYRSILGAIFFIKVMWGVVVLCKNITNMSVIARIKHNK